MRWVVDASVAIKWVVDEQQRDAARRFLIENVDLVAPEFLLVEIANILRSKVARQEVGRDQARSALEAIRLAVPTLVPDKDLVGPALDLTLKLDHPSYDCMYLACAVDYDANLITADTRLIGKLKQTVGWERVQSLEGHRHPGMA